jgi:hypothetical protein
MRQVSITQRTSRNIGQLGKEFVNEFPVLPHPKPSTVVDYASACASARRMATALQTDYLGIPSP